jgi:hypothetical protein
MPPKRKNQKASKEIVKRPRHAKMLDEIRELLTTAAKNPADRLEGKGRGVRACPGNLRGTSSSSSAGLAL